jgi:hypothetical protein
MREKSLLRERKRIMARKGVTWREAGEMQNRIRNRMGGYKMTKMTTAELVRLWFKRWGLGERPQSREERMWRIAMRKENERLSTHYLEMPQGGYKCGKGWHGHRREHRIARLRGKVGGRKYDTSSVKRVNIEGYVFYAYPDLGNNILKVWEANDYRKRIPPTWQFSLRGLPEDTGNAVKQLYESGALKSYHYGGKMKWMGRGVVSIGGVRSPHLLPWKQHHSKVIKLEDGTLIRFEKIKFDPKGMVSRK